MIIFHPVSAGCVLTDVVHSAMGGKEALDDGGVKAIFYF